MRWPLALLLILSCKDPPPRAKPDAATPEATAVPREASAPATTSSAPPAPPPPPPAPSDGGTSACKLLFGPAELPLKGGAEIMVNADSVDVVFNEGGKPRKVRFPSTSAGKPDAGAQTPAPAGYPPCAVAGTTIFCAEKDGDVKRFAAGDETGVHAANSRAGTRISAAMLEGHAVLGYLASRKTTEGFTSEAWAQSESLTPVRISEDGAGATSVELGARGSTVVAMMLDGRSAMTPVHAKILRWKGKIEGEKDAVVFIGGAPERSTMATLGTQPSGTAFVLLPIARDVNDFGVASILIGDVPQVDTPARWSIYPNGLDPAPIVATKGTSPIRVARVRPEKAQAGSAQVLEVGKLDDKGDFVSDGIIPTAGGPRDLALATDGQGMVWIHYTDKSGSWIERRACP